MNRRAFLQGLVATAAGVYVPAKTFFLPPAGGWPVQFVPVEFGVHTLTVQHDDTLIVHILTEKMLAEHLKGIWNVGKNPDIILADSSVRRYVRHVNPRVQWRKGRRA